MYNVSQAQPGVDPILELVVTDTDTNVVYCTKTITLPLGEKVAEIIASFPSYLMVNP